MIPFFFTGLLALNASFLRVSIPCCALLVWVIQACYTAYGYHPGPLSRVLVYQPLYALAYSTLAYLMSGASLQLQPFIDVSGEWNLATSSIIFLVVSTGLSLIFTVYTSPLGLACCSVGVLVAFLMFFGVTHNSIKARLDTKRRPSGQEWILTDNRYASWFFAGLALNNIIFFAAHFFLWVKVLKPYSEHWVQLIAIVPLAVVAMVYVVVSFSKKKNRDRIENHDSDTESDSDEA